MELRIDEVCYKAGVRARTLRHYDAIGLLEPASVDDQGRRYYGEAELAKLDRILLLRRLGLSLSDVLVVVDNFDNDDAAAAAKLANRLAELKAEATQRDKQIRVLELTLNALAKGEPLAPFDQLRDFVPNGKPGWRTTPAHINTLATWQRYIPDADPEDLWSGAGTIWHNPRPTRPEILNDAANFHWPQPCCVVASGPIEVRIVDKDNRQIGASYVLQPEEEKQFDEIPANPNGWYNIHARALEDDGDYLVSWRY
jgi:DNA-binding transcriptional MerR regulator